MDDTLLDEWFTKSQAAAVLQVSEKTIERLARKGEIRRETRKRPGVRPSARLLPGRPHRGYQGLGQFLGHAVSCSLIHSRRASSIRVCHPRPSTLK